jgi:hypothetical protein
VVARRSGGEEEVVESLAQAAEVVDGLACFDEERELDRDFSPLDVFSEPDDLSEPDDFPDDFSELDDFSEPDDFSVDPLVGALAATLPLVRLSVA